LGHAAGAAVRGVLALRPSGNVVELEPSEAGQVFDGFGQARFRTAMARACRRAGVPHYHPHDLRHRLVSRLHADGVSWARIGEQVGHGDLVTTARTYTHVIADEAELDYNALPVRDRVVLVPVLVLGPRKVAICRRRSGPVWAFSTGLAPSDLA
jgi:integrase